MRAKRGGICRRARLPARRDTNLRSRLLDRGLCLRKDWKEIVMPMLLMKVVIWLKDIGREHDSMSVPVALQESRTNFSPQTSLFQVTQMILNCRIQPTFPAEASW